MKYFKVRYGIRLGNTFLDRVMYWFCPDGAYAIEATEAAIEDDFDTLNIGYGTDPVYYYIAEEITADEFNRGIQCGVERCR